MSSSQGDLFIVSSPSGGGKTTLIRKVMAAVAEWGWTSHFSVSHTTRPPRAGEENGVDYYFVDRPTFLEMVKRGEFLEWAEYVGNLYGTSRAAVETWRAKGADVFLDIEVQGAEQVRRQVPEAISVFVLPPSLAVLKQRLETRGKDAPALIDERIRIAGQEIAKYSQFDYVIINDRLEEAVEALKSIVIAAHCRTARQAAPAQRILHDFRMAGREA